MLGSTNYYESYRLSLTKQLTFLTKAGYAKNTEAWLNAFGNLLKIWFSIEEGRDNHKKLIDDLKKRGYL